MTVRLTISAVLISTILVLGFLSLNFTKEYCNNLITETNKALNEYNLDQLISVQQKWKKIVLYLSIVTPHEHIDDTSESFDRAIMFLKFGTRDEFSAEISKIINNIQIIKNYDYPSLRSIF